MVKGHPVETVNPSHVCQTLKGKVRTDEKHDVLFDMPPRRRKRFIVYFILDSKVPIKPVGIHIFIKYLSDTELRRIYDLVISWYPVLNNFIEINIQIIFSLPFNLSYCFHLTLYFTFP